MQTVRLKTANIFRGTARYTLLVLAILVFIFALISGSQELTGGITGIIKNSPNAIPWLILLIFVYVAWKWELAGGIVITLLGLVMLYFFVFASLNFFLATFILTLLIIVLEAFFILSWHLRKERA